MHVQHNLALVALLVGLAIATTLTANLTTHAGLRQGEGSPGTSAAIFDSGVVDDDLDRAGFDHLFIGQVVGVSKMGQEPTSDPEDPIPLIHYTVDVERVLKGRVANRVEVQVLGIGGDGEYDEDGDGAPRQGRRYLFFAGRPLDDGSYAITPGLQEIEIDSAQEELRLVRAFEAMIPTAEAVAATKAAEARGRAAEAEPVEPPEVELEPDRGPAGSEVRVSGRQFAPGQILITWDIEGHGAQAVVDASFRFRTRITVPRTAEPGTHTIRVQDGVSPPVEIPFVVTAP